MKKQTQQKPTRPKQALRWLALTTLVLLVASACSFFTGDDDEDTAATTTTLAADDPDLETTEPQIISGSTSTVPGASPLNADAKLSTAGLGPVLIGHSFEQALAASGGVLVQFPDGTDTCKIYGAGADLPGVFITAIDDEVQRIDVAEGSTSTVSGFGIGSSVTDLRSAFGERIQDGPNTGEIQFVPVDAGDADKRVVWLVDEGIAVSMRAGRVPYVNSRTFC